MPKETVFKMRRFVLWNVDNRWSLHGNDVTEIVNKLVAEGRCLVKTFCGGCALMRNGTYHQQRAKR